MAEQAKPFQGVPMRQPISVQKLFSLEDFLNTVTYFGRCKSGYPEGEQLSSRIPLPDSHRLSKEQQHVANEVAAGPRGEVRGPVRVWLYSPELAARAQKLGEFLRWDTVLAPRISELVILVTARTTAVIIFGLITLPWLCSTA